MMTSPKSDHIVIDSTGETLLLLEIPSAGFAVWTDSEDVDYDSQDTNAENIDDAFVHEGDLEEESTSNWAKWEEQGRT